jgi:hypothetical protein
LKKDVKSKISSSCFAVDSHKPPKLVYGFGKIILIKHSKKRMEKFKSSLALKEGNQQHSKLMTRKSLHY